MSGLSSYASREIRRKMAPIKNLILHFLLTNMFCKFLTCFHGAHVLHFSYKNHEQDSAHRLKPTLEVRVFSAVLLRCIHETGAGIISIIPRG